MMEMMKNVMVVSPYIQNRKHGAMRQTIVLLLSLPGFNLTIAQEAWTSFMGKNLLFYFGYSLQNVIWTPSSCNQTGDECFGWGASDYWKYCHSFAGCWSYAIGIISDDEKIPFVENLGAVGISRKIRLFWSASDVGYGLILNL